MRARGERSAREELRSRGRRPRKGGEANGFGKQALTTPMGSRMPPACAVRSVRASGSLSDDSDSGTRKQD